MSVWRCTVALLLVWIVAVACGGDGATPTATPRQPLGTATEIASATGLPAASPTLPKSTGIAELDAVIEALAARDREQLRSLVRLNAVPCTTEFGLGGPPKCEAGEQEGDIVEVFYSATCEGGYQRDLDRIADGLARWSVYGAYRVGAGFGYTSESFAELGFPTQYVVVVYGAADPERLGTELLIADGRIVGSVFSCALPVRDLVAQRTYEEVLLEPADG